MAEQEAAKVKELQNNIKYQRKCSVSPCIIVAFHWYQVTWMWLNSFNYSKTNQYPPAEKQAGMVSPFGKAMLGALAGAVAPMGVQGVPQ